MYTLKRVQFLPINIQEAWEFFSSPKNLVLITPSRMKFSILSMTHGPKMYAGQIIKYRVNILPFIAVKWVTEIRQVNEPYHFADVQLAGPYRHWHHEHFFKEVPGGVEMTDEVRYAIPFGLIGRITNHVFVKHELSRIFDYRFKVLQKRFSKVVTEST